MKLVIFTIRDNVAEVFNKPFTDLNNASAIRSFTQSLKDEPQKQDYTLYRVATLDQVTGKVKPENDPIQLMTGFEIVQEEEGQTIPFLKDQAI